MKKIIFSTVVCLPLIFILFVFQGASFYSYIDKPMFSLPLLFSGILWISTYICNTVHLILSIKDFGCHILQEYFVDFTITYVFHQLFIISFFIFHHLFLAIVMIVISLLSSLFLYYEAKSFSKKYIFLLLPYIYLLLFQVIIQFTIYFLNL